MSPLPRKRARIAAAAAGALLLAALPALAQESPESILPPGFGEQPSPPPGQQQQPAPGTPSRGQPPVRATVSGQPATIDEAALLQPVVVQVELPAGSRRDARAVGAFPPAQLGLGEQPWGRSSGKFLSVLMRRTDTPLASRWGHILLRNALLARAAAPADVHPADWVAERAWLLLRMGEADAARMLVAGVDVADFTPKLTQVAVQSALASADPAALCPIEQRMGRADPAVAPLVAAMCASLSGGSEVAAARIEAARRRGRFQPIDLVLADKVVGAGADTARSVTVEWDDVDRINAWRFGLATATGMTFPDRLTAAAPARVRAWQARAPLLSAEQRLASARIATGLGVMSAQALIDLYALIYDSTDPSDLPDTDSWQLRLAMVGKDKDKRIAAIRGLLGKGQGPLEKEANRALVARAAAFVAPDAELGDIVPELIAAMLAAGDDRAAARWAGVVDDLDDQSRNRAWAMLALAVPGFEISRGSLDDFIGDDDSPNRQRSALLVAGLAGLGKISLADASALSRRNGFGLARRNAFTNLIDGASLRRQPGTVALLGGIALQADNFQSVPAMNFYHLVTALNRNGQQYAARMIAAEALART
jgi:hypothetical protein